MSCSPQWGKIPDCATLDCLRLLQGTKMTAPRRCHNMPQRSSKPDVKDTASVDEDDSSVFVARCCNGSFREVSMRCSSGTPPTSIPTFLPSRTSERRKGLSFKYSTRHTCALSPYPPTPPTPRGGHNPPFPLLMLLTAIGSIIGFWSWT